MNSLLQQEQIEQQKYVVGCKFAFPRILKGFIWSLVGIFILNIGYELVAFGLDNIHWSQVRARVGYEFFGIVFVTTLQMFQIFKREIFGSESTVDWG